MRELLESARDTVHQGDRDGVKGIYLLNLVDEVTQFEFVGAVVGISERVLVPLLAALRDLDELVAARHALIKDRTAR